ncbi:multidrug effflux MFS transporter [Frigidibacter mobilis]|uniref:Bcr/CflA family efflux transporter n=1 Tax=Frigidibacter mobilis TaxID=1335048 RepID=A0A159Z409_9RHOB|nr:multidrug effflux MFS transporter [Frigidibacter mobilis]AMY69871.1 Bcr/CflA subfamily drug resistance transporter [Frigidibacter mobilis]
MTDTPPQSGPQSGPTIRRLPMPEFVAMLATLFATIAFSIDAMLPALPQIAAELVPNDVNRAQLILTSFVLGMGVGTLFAGPISDATGRKIAITGGFGLYILGAVLAWRAQSIEMLLLARFLQGLGAAGPRIVSLALIRDLYQGREMARVTSFVMMIFILIPAVAPSIGAVVIAFTGWRGIFGAFILFGLIGLLWLNLRQAETLPPAKRRPLTVISLAAAAREVLADREVRVYTVVMTLGFGQMFAVLSSSQQLFSETYGRGDSFPLWFAGMALLAGTGSILNARFVVRLGMRRIAVMAYMMQTCVSAVMLVLALTGALPAWAEFPAFFFWVTSVFFMAGVTFGNLNALALQRMGHIAGMAASIVAAVSTVLAVVIAAPLGLMFDGTARPLIVGVLVCSGLAWGLMRRTVTTG